MLSAPAGLRYGAGGAFPLTQSQADL